MGIKDRRTKILLSLLLLSDVKFEYVSINGKLQNIFDLSFNQKTRGTISGLIREGLIEKPQAEKKNTEIPDLTTLSASTISNLTNLESTPSSLPASNTNLGTNTYCLTETGFYALCLKFPFFRFLRDKWDSKWRILSYEIPEKKREIRDKLRREISGWGLGPWHRSFWLTPHPIIENLRELIYQKEEEQYIQAFESEYVVGKRDILIEKVWQKSALEKKYREIFKIWHDTLSKEGEKLEKFKNVVSEYVEILKIDPGLPQELVGQNWIGFEAFNIFKEIRSILLS
ncbi:hypothetical protein A3I50_01615 [Candidatus Roizmanbacteria bacterium RIFCSPLOWO2_02_FULL_37_9]|uniref:Uncharacterized protein n=1 Tax=Candidatus Roizmanbacteria bacterium RIFCSPLOWO2_01_FULL_37_16 TaxID=1802058 RepID=A0A1F7IK58_9BACT|nr:MAG: hypothetical protein A2859_05810 [Candidatus Roizmanbacteria bacterium RIFCSPHIGHO2_01_FULL_37_16b]OGK31594.1 MAG: hypothetical protein A3F57_04170 [Candidatus Roizmanbacteria bacterium RIFCSPHIGHO2_12_FULL_36_11]OGK43751.1 MAG: hypothetical protein A3B40_02935 [Candidatus Roizmanbacteria bacterium RIFCSPLOWO2_01_FULL_37_16]OGK57740.1 MAG: hypothetical protein A3I50_01615 [Candidatus Roizmanbacteria bacterium RIFCSPLOWO2_02_FULL_37_9]